MKRYILRGVAVMAALFLCQDLPAQEKPIKPIDLPMSFAGNYGELRHNHFHQGLDWRVGGKVGDPIHAIKSGYVSRISVSPTGYGNAVYINHPDGTYSVYGHMLSFRSDIAARVKEEQYSQKSFIVNFFPEPDEFPLKQGEVFGRVGNTGASAGPHLHMEVRDTEKDLPLNYIAMGYYSPKDNMSPVFRRVVFYGLDSTAVPSARQITSIRNPEKYRSVIYLPHKSYVAIDAYDTQDGTTGKLAIENYKVILDGRTIFNFTVGDVSYTEGPYIKSLVQQGVSGPDLVKSRMDPGNLLQCKADVEDGGIIMLEDYDIHQLRIEVKDICGNSSALNFKVRREDSKEPLPAIDTTAIRREFLWYAPNIVREEGMTYILQLGALCDNAVFSFKKISPRDRIEEACSDVWEISSPGTALMKGGILEIESSVPDSLASKAFLASVSSVGRLSWAGSKVGPGRYCIAVDTKAPQISPGKGGNYSIRDDCSGVSEVSLEIDGQWHLFKFYRGVLTILDRGSISRGKHRLTITAKDNCGNISEYTGTLAL